MASATCWVMTTHSKTSHMQHQCKIATQYIRYVVQVHKSDTPHYIVVMVYD